MKKQDIFKEIKEWLTTEDWDEYVYEVKANEAQSINNAGIDVQLDYLLETWGLDWLYTAFILKKVLPYGLSELLNQGISLAL